MEDDGRRDYQRALGQHMRPIFVDSDIFIYAAGQPHPQHHGLPYLFFPRDRDRLRECRREGKLCVPASLDAPNVSRRSEYIRISVSSGRRSPKHSGGDAPVRPGSKAKIRAVAPVLQIVAAGELGIRDWRFEI